jgi:Holliday junction DNA helicase RuvA
VASLGSEDVSRLVSIPGIGRKTAERMIIDLKEKVRKMELRAALPEAGQRPKDDMAEDVISALVNLGYKRGQAEKAVEGVLRQRPGLKLEEALRASLLILSAG